jgi:hypothetical protein
MLAPAIPLIATIPNSEEAGMPHPVQRIAVQTGDMDTMLASINDGRGTTRTASFDARTAAVTRLFEIRSSR